MKAAQSGNYTSAPSGDTRKFEGTLNRLGTTVAEKDMRKALRRETRKAFKQTRTHIVIDDFRTGDETLCLRRESRSNFWSPMPYVGYTVTRGTVEVLAPLVIP